MWTRFYSSILDRKGLPPRRLSVTAWASAVTRRSLVSALGLLLPILASVTVLVSMSACRAAVQPDTQREPTLPPSRVPVLSIADASAAEDSASMAFTVRLTADRGRTVSVDYATEPGTAEAGSDYRAASGTLTFRPREALAQIVRVPILDDRLVEADETFTVTLSGASNATLAAAVATGTIIDDDALAVTVTAAPHTVEEGSPAGFAVTLTGAISSEVTLEWATADGTARAGADYEAVAGGTLTFRPDAAPTRRLAVRTLQDDLEEGTETFTVNLMQVVLPAGQQVGPATATGTITDDDALSVGVSADALAVVEGEAATFTLALSGASATAPVVVDYTVTGSARAGSDYTAPGGSLTLASGAATGRLTIRTLADEEPEAEESIFVTLERAHTATRTVAVDPTAARTRIADRGTATISVAPAVSVAAAAVEEGNPAQFVVTLSRAVAADVTVEWKTEAVLGASAAATAGRDYRGVAAATIDLGAGSTAATLEVQTLDDALNEADETFAVTLTGVNRSAGVALGAATAIVTIGDNDDPPSLTIADRDAPEDAGTMEFPVTLDAESGRRVTVDYSTQSRDATENRDYTRTRGTLSFRPGDLEQIISVPIRQDDLDEPERETFAVALRGAVNAELDRRTATGTITDDDSLTASVAAAALAVTEGETATFTVTVTGATGTAPVLVAYSLGGTAEAGSDYTAPGGSLTLATGARNGTIAIRTHADHEPETNEAVSVMLDSATTAARTVTVSAVVASITIADRGLPTVSVAPATVEEGETAGFVVTLNDDVASTVSVRWLTTHGTATAATDYTAASGTLTFSTGGSRSRTLEVTTLEDQLDEPAETFTVRLTEVLPATAARLGVATAAGTIADDDAPPMLTIADNSAYESAGAISFPVTLDAESALQVMVNYMTESRDATAGADYTWVADTLAFRPGERSRMISVPIRQDDLVEAEQEHFAVTLSGPVNATLGAHTATGSIVDDDTLLLSVAADSVTVIEGAAATFTIAATGATSTGPVVVGYLVGGTAGAGTDYTAPAGSLTLAAGAARGKITVHTLRDTAADSDETIIVTLDSATSAARVLQVNAASATTRIADAGRATASVAATEPAVTEGERADFAVTLSETVPETVTIGWRTTDLTAAAGADYSAVAGGTITFTPGGSRRQTVTVATLEDQLDEPAERFMVTLTGAQPSSAVSLGTTTATATITDDDAPPGLNIADARASENAGTIPFLVTLAPASARVVTVYYETRDDTALGGSGLDYTKAEGELTFTPGAALRHTIEVPIADDSLDEDDEAFNVVLRQPLNATIGRHDATGTITDNDALPQLSIADSSALESAGTLPFTVTLTPASGRTVTVFYEALDDTAETDLDFTKTEGELTFRPGGDLQQTISVPILQDALDEGDQESFTMKLLNEVNATLQDDAATGVITDDDDPPPDDHGDTHASATTATPGVVISGALQAATDVDYFRISVSASATVHVATDRGKFGDPGYRATVVRLESSTYTSPNNDNYDTARVTGGPGEVYVRVSGASAARYDLAAWVLDSSTSDSSYDIELRYIGTQPSASQRSTLRAAADVLEGVISRGLSSRLIIDSDWNCEDGDPSLFGENIDDLLILVRLQRIDGAGGTLGQAGPCLRRSGGLPLVGDVALDTADLGRYGTADLRRLGVHEMAHVLGFGNSSRWNALLDNPAKGFDYIPGQNTLPDTHFDGTAANSAFDEVGGDSYTGGDGVPVENNTEVYDAGGLDGHWREAVFASELMTATFSSGQPLSKVSIGALADLGYSVSYGQAESYTLPSTTSSRLEAAGHEIDLGNDIRQGPVFVVDVPEQDIPVITP